MFENPGKKLQKLAKVIFVLMLLPSILLGILVIVGGGSIADQYGIHLGFTEVLIGVVIILVGILTAWLSSIKLYAMGTAIDDVQSIKKLYIGLYRKMERYEKRIQGKPDVLPEIKERVSVDEDEDYLI